MNLNLNDDLISLIMRRMFQLDLTLCAKESRIIDIIYTEHNLLGRLCNPFLNEFRLILSAGAIILAATSSLLCR